MARLFDDASNEYLRIEQVVLATMPCAYVCRFNMDAFVTHHMLMVQLDKDANNQFQSMWVRTENGTHNLRVYSESAVTAAAARSLFDIQTGTWYHAAGLFVSATDRRAFVDGANKATSATAVTPANLDRTSLGVNDPTGGQHWFLSGMIAEAAIYDLSKWPGASDSDKADNFERILPSLAAGFTPNNFPLGLVAYWDLMRGLNDKFGGYNLTADGTVVVAHPDIISPCGIL